MFKVKVPFRIQKKIKKFPQKIIIKIRKVLASLVYNPYIGKKLEGKYKDKYSIRVWPYRIIYKIEKKQLIVEVVEIDHRGGAYKKKK